MYGSSYWVISDSGKDNDLFYMERGLKGSKFLNFDNLEGIHNLNLSSNFFDVSTRPECVCNCSNYLPCSLHLNAWNGSCQNFHGNGFISSNIMVLYSPKSTIYTETCENTTF
jgi:hypothetical protein